MEWITKQASFKYNDTPVTRITMTCKTPLGVFKVYEAIGGLIFYTHPFLRDAFELRINGQIFNGDPEGTFACNELKTRVMTIESGIKACEEKWEQVKKAINSI